MKASRSAMIMAGGTGGHVFPGLAIATALRERDWDVSWIGTSRGLESRVVPDNGLQLHTLKTLGLRGKGIGAKIKGIVSLLLSCLQALWLLTAHRPSVVVGFGGYAAGPAGVVAWLLRIPVVIHEQNAVAGTTNRLLSRAATRVLAGFDGAFASGLPALSTGNPVRSALANVPSKAYPEAGFSKAQPLKLAILGGSQGALALNRGLPTALSKLSSDALACIAVRHQCGRNHYDVTMSAWSTVCLADLEVAPFVEDMAELYHWADVAICRAGALTVCELAVTGTPSVLVPLPNAIDNHQLKNAEALRDAGGAIVVEQNDLESGTLEAFIADILMQSQRLTDMSTAAKAWSKPDATQQVVAVIEEVVCG
jgi:UDP-N-acetylglucosamine--N-acetylmuramyl-(pentapeptide) pyrophosphoryl-undecaprenol N-acetylglucosamine transferase